MDSDTMHTRKMGPARGQLSRAEQKLAQGKRSFDAATHRRLVGGVILLIGVLALIGFLVQGNSFVAVIAIAGLGIGGVVFLKAQANRRGARDSIDTFTDTVTDARAKLEELESQSDEHSAE